MSQQQWQCVARKVLLMYEVLIGRDKYFKPILFCGVKQFAVLELRPATFVCSRDFVLRQRFPQGHRYSLIKQYAHLSGSQRTPSSMFEDGANLFERNAGKPLHELG